MRYFPTYCSERTAFIRTIIALLISFVIVAPAGAATYQFDFGGPTGTFEAPLGGGLISAFNITISNTTFDTIVADNTQPFYNPILNSFNGLFDVEFRGAGQSTGAVFNSAPSASCLAGDLCVLELFDTVGGTAAPEWAFQNITQLSNVSGGFYAIDPVPVSPVPLPAALPLFVGGLGLLSLFGGRRRRGSDL